MGVLKDLIQNALDLPKEPDYTPCPRRTKWTKDDPPAWRVIRSNALLGLVGTYRRFGAHCYYEYSGKLLAFRAGEWKDWWKYDLLYEAARLHLNGVVLLWENNDELTVVELDGEAGVLEPVRVGDPPRLAKNLPKAGQCWYCPVRQKCDAWDEVHGQTEDWPEKWRKY